MAQAQSSEVSCRLYIGMWKNWPFDSWCTPVRALHVGCVESETGDWCDLKAKRYKAIVNGSADDCDKTIASSSSPKK